MSGAISGRTVLGTKRLVSKDTDLFYLHTDRKLQQDEKSIPMSGAISGRTVLGSIPKIHKNTILRHPIHPFLKVTGSHEVRAWIPIAKTLKIHQSGIH
jgi:hypothetical protein